MRFVCPNCNTVIFENKQTEIEFVVKFIELMEENGLGDEAAFLRGYLVGMEK